MRQNTKWIMLITALAFVGLMVFEWGMDLSGRSGAQLQGGEIGSIDGEPVTSEEYNQVYRSLYEQQQQAQGEALTSTQVRELEQAAWEQLVQDRLINREIERLDIGVNDDEIAMAAMNAPPPTFQQAPIFQTDGQFDIEKYRQFLTSPTTDPQLLQQLEAYYRELIPRNRLLQRVAAGVFVPDSELWRIYRDRVETATIRYLLLEPEQLIPDAAVSSEPSEVRAYYESHEEDFRQPATARVRYAMLEMSPNAADTAAALEQARQLRAEIHEGTDFGEVARRESADAGSATAGGQLGQIRRGQTVASFEQAAFSATIGEVTEPVLSPFGYHLIQVSERTDSTVTARHILVPIELTREHENVLLARADSLEDVTEEQSLDQAASALGLQVREAMLNREQPFLPGLSDVQEGVTWAFDEAEVGEPSPVFETEQAFYIMELLERRPEQIVPLAEAEPAIRARLATQKKLERTHEIARDIVDRLRQGMSMEDIATQQEIAVQQAGPFSRTSAVPGLGRTNAAVGAAFGLEPGQYSDPVEANGRVFVIQLVERTEADREAFEAQKQDMRAAVTGSLEEMRVQQYIRSLRESADVRDRRAEAAAAARNAPAQPQPGLF